jgi:DNA-binding CsgD family transcriptional regulator
LVHYAEGAQCLAELRAGPGILLVTRRGRILLIDNRSAGFCQQMRVVTEDREGTLPLPIVKIVNEIAESLEVRGRHKDGKPFSVRRVIEGRQGSISVEGIGLPATGHGTERRILLTLQMIIPRTSVRRMDAFHLTPRETTVVERLLKGETNKEIAQAMGISEQTTKEHIKHILRKTKTTTRTGIIMAIAGPREMVMSQAISERLPEPDPATEGRKCRSHALTDRRSPVRGTSVE